MKKASWKNKVTLKVSSVNFEIFLNNCSNSGILLGNICFLKDYYLCTMTFKDFKRIRKIAVESGVKISIVKKWGVGYYIHNRRKRYGFYAGALISFLLIIYLTSCIWVVDVVGNTITDDSQIKRVLSRYGIGIGKLRYGKKISYIKNMSLIELDSLAWLWVNLDGTRAVVEVREKGDSEEIYNASDYCNLIAKYPGVITDMRVRHGRKIVKRDEVVQKGQLLVSGIASSDYNGNRYINSTGEIFAKTWRSAEGEYKTHAEYKLPTGNKAVKKSMCIFGKKVRLYSQKHNYKLYEKHSSEKQIKFLENIYLPLTFTTETFCEIIMSNKDLSYRTVVENAVSELTAKIENEREPDAKTLNVSYTDRILDNGNVYVCVTVESEENIAQRSAIQVGMSEE